MTWLRPTWTIAGVLLLPVALSALYALGLPVGRRGDWFGFDFPSPFDWALIAATGVLTLDVLGCLASAAWRRWATR